MTTKFNLTINPLTVILLIGFVICLVIIFRSCQYDPGEEIGRLQGEVAEKDKQIAKRDDQLKIKDEALEEIREEYEEKISELNGEIDSSNTIIENVNAESDKNLKELEKKDTALTDYKDKYKNMTAQRDDWENRFTLVVREKDSVIFSTQEQYEEEKRLREATETVLSDHKIALAERDNALVSRDELIESLKKKLRTKNRWQTLERLAFVGVAGLFLYNAVS